MWAWRKGRRTGGEASPVRVQFHGSQRATRAAPIAPTRRRNQSISLSLSPSLSFPRAADTGGARPTVERRMVHSHPWD
jgi:hypothetical protein